MEYLFMFIMSYTCSCSSIRFVFWVFWCFCWSAVLNSFYLHPPCFWSFSSCLIESIMRSIMSFRLFVVVSRWRMILLAKSMKYLKKCAQMYNCCIFLFQGPTIWLRFCKIDIFLLLRYDWGGQIVGLPTLLVLVE